MSVPGAQTSGLIRPSRVGPADERSAIRSGWPATGSARSRGLAKTRPSNCIVAHVPKNPTVSEPSVAPTVSVFFAVAGEPTLAASIRRLASASRPSLPEAQVADVDGAAREHERRLADVPVAGRDLDPLLHRLEDEPSTGCDPPPGA